MFCFYIHIFYPKSNSFRSLGFIICKKGAAHFFILVQRPLLYVYYKVAYPNGKFLLKSTLVYRIRKGNILCTVALYRRIYLRRSKYIILRMVYPVNIFNICTGI